MKSTPPSGACRDPFDDILDAVVSGDSSASDQTLFNDTLRTDPDARRAYIRAMAFEAMLATEFAPIGEVSKKVVHHSRWLMPIAIAATIMLASTLAWWRHPGQAAPQVVVGNPVIADDEITHAVITSLDNAHGRFGTAPLVQGMRLASNELELDSGIVEITFDTGAEITLEGPARMQVASENQARLSTGRASAMVPEPARGFVILTPSSYIRDHGTLAVEVGENHETDLHVIEGEVEVSTTGRKANNSPKILRKKEALRLSNGKMFPINFREDTPSQRQKKHSRKIPPSVHWSFDAWEGTTTIDSARGHTLKFQQAQSPAMPETVDGPFDRGLHFDGQATYATSDYPGVGGSQARTVACWVRIQPDASTTKPNGIISWGVDHSRGKWQVAWNTDQSQGAVGAPLVEFGDGFVIGSTDLRDGRWHHLAVVYLGGPKANVATHVRIYVDGRLESPTGRRQRRIMTDTTSANARPLTLGRHLDDSSDSAAMFFEGDLDEVHVFEGDLLPAQIMRLMKRNELRPNQL